ncbi:leucine-rich repeat-containing protein 15-like [Contarinia nasturtii]|uniref:leucine-rich repeat-containing protein 15-like n=1 Tax=Contarinia nasturtii TaxID=265458 RepID=UPI0012D3B6BD|nr:leucine-rich repeat-containing protein 15-like [Contarinia nasturtii]
MHTFIISNLELESLDVQMFSNANNVSNLIVSQNSLKEIPALLLVNAKRLKYADFSNNSIKHIFRFAFMGVNSLEVLDLSRNAISTIDSDAFIDLRNLKSLNLSYNEIRKIYPQTFNVFNLLALDLSNNKVHYLDKSTFNYTNFVNLKHLNLSENSISDLAVGIFSFMPNLEYLNLRRTNLSDIKFGTFSHQHKLILLDLSENNLKKLDFSLFMPIMHDLQSLELDGNQLIDLDGFSNSLFPQLRTLDIKHNNFNCSHLIKFMKSVNWEKIRIPIEANSVKSGETSIRGVKCRDMNRPELPEGTSNDISTANKSTLDANLSTWNRNFHIKRNFFTHFPNVHTINLSNVGLESLQKEIFNEATNVSKLILSKNHLTEIPTLVFINAKNLTFANFSENQIMRIDSLAFAGANKLQTLDLSNNDLRALDEVFIGLSGLRMLNLSYNKLSGLSSRNFSTCKLWELDVSHNNISMIKEHAFDELSDLRLLNLSFNPVGDLTSDRFTYLLNLEHLNLKRTNLSTIERGALSHQHKLISLDLSENNLKIFDFKLFFPIQHDLRALYLGGNQLSHLNGFRNTLFPQLTLFDINNNKYNCRYLEHFMESINWEKIRFLVDLKSINPQGMNIRGINCEATGHDESTDADSPESSQDNGFIKLILGFICIIMLAYLIIRNHDRIYTRN